MKNQIFKAPSFSRIFRLPDGIELKPIKNHADVAKAHSVYPFCDVVPLDFFLGQAKFNPSVGAYTKDGTLVAWVFRSVFFSLIVQCKENGFVSVKCVIDSKFFGFFRCTTGPLLALQTNKDHFGHGYGSVVTRAISKQIAELGHDLYAGIFEENKPSRNLFEKLGYRSIGNFHWICTKFSWTDNELNETSL